MSVISEAFATWRECRAEYDDTLYSQYERAEEACRGAMLNARGRERGVDPLSLFMGNARRAHAYASAELVEHWQDHPRITYAMFERDWLRAREAELLNELASAVAA